MSALDTPAQTPTHMGGSLSMERLIKYTSNTEIERQWMTYCPSRGKTKHTSALDDVYSARAFFCIFSLPLHACIAVRVASHLRRPV
jgi:hypothetical protein